MLINLRNAMMAGKRLPYDAEVEYLESTGTQWIDTGMKKTSGTTIDCTFSLSATNTKAIFGARTSSTAPDRIMLVAVGTNFRFDADMQRSFGTTDTASMFRFQYDGTNATITNLTTGTTSTSSTQIGDAGVLDISLFGVNTNGVVGLLMQGRMYAFKIWNNGVLVRDFIPVRKGTVGYLYDRVSGKLFGNAGTGDFVLGPDVVPVEYIESHGTEWIDTGVMSSRCYGAYLDFKAIDFANYMFFVSNATAGDFYVGTNANSTANPYSGRIRRSLWHSGSIDKTAFVALSCKGGKILLNDVEKGTYDDTLPLAQNDNTIRMFGLSGTQRLSKCAIRRFDLYNSSQEAIFKALPVRVGTDATSWEGAMMDVLTRRIYRNAGTGAFTYGNDLKYPIPAA